jgi:histidinol-phosphate/aromatic aminotransferase/cobyric acid decarboxylase-like protein
VTQQLEARQILVRDKSSAPGCDGCLRLTAGVLAHTERALRALEEILAARTN